MTTRVGILTRFSSDRQHDRSLEDQERICRRHAEAQGWTVTMVVGDAAKSGASTAGRAGYQKVIDAAESGQLDVVLVDDLSRLSARWT